MTDPITPERVAELRRHYDNGVDDALEGLLELMAIGHDRWLTNPKSRANWRESLKAYQADHVALLAEVERLRDELDIPDQSLSPTEPAELTAWLRTLPVGAIVVDKRGDAWQVRACPYGPGRCINRVAAQRAYALTGPIDEAREIAEWAPYRLVWTTGGA